MIPDYTCMKCLLQCHAARVNPMVVLSTDSKSGIRGLIVGHAKCSRGVHQEFNASVVTTPSLIFLRPHQDPQMALIYF